MTKFQKLVYTYVLRLVGFCMIAVVFTAISHLVSFFEIPGFTFLPLLYFVPFTVFYLIEETEMNRVLKLVLRVISFAAFFALAFIFYEGWVIAVVGICLFALMFYNTEAKICELDEMTGETWLAIGLNLIMSIFSFTIHSLSVNYYIANPGTAFNYDRANLYIVSLILLALSVTAFMLCKYYESLSIISRHRLWYAQAQDIARRFRRRSQRLMVTFIGTGLALTFLLAIPTDIIDPFAPRPPAENPRDLPQDWRESDVNGSGGSFSLLRRREVVQYEFEQVYAMPADYRPWWYLILEWLLRILITAAVIAAGIVLIKIFSKLRAGIGKVKLGDYEYGEEQESYAEPKPSRKWNLKLSVNQRIRAMFKRKVNEHRKQGLYIKTADTAKLISAGISGKEDITVLTDLYHTARYSGKKLSVADIAALRKKK